MASYSEITNLIERQGIEKTFDDLTLDLFTQKQIVDECTRELKSATNKLESFKASICHVATKAYRDNTIPLITSNGHESLEIVRHRKDKVHVYRIMPNNGTINERIHTITDFKELSK